jgi:hypothetical protein
MEDGSLSRSRVEAILRYQLESAKERYRAASGEFPSIVQSTRTHISARRSPYPDSRDIERLAALAELQNSLSRFNGFIVDGIVPDDLIQRPSRNSETACG